MQLGSSLHSTNITQLFPANNRVRPKRRTDQLLFIRVPVGCSDPNGAHVAVPVAVRTLEDLPTVHQFGIKRFFRALCLRPTCAMAICATDSAVVAIWLHVPQKKWGKKRRHHHTRQSRQSRLHSSRRSRKLNTAALCSMELCKSIFC